MDEYGIFQSIVEADAVPTKPANDAQTDGAKPTSTSSAGSSSTAGAKPASSTPSTGGSKPTNVKESSIDLV